MYFFFLYLHEGFVEIVLGNVYIVSFVWETTSVKNLNIYYLIVFKKM